MSQAIALQPRNPRSLTSAPNSSRLARPRAVSAPAHDEFGASAATQVSVVDLIGYLGKHWKLGALIALPLAVATFAFLGMGKKVYEAEARLRLNIQDGNTFFQDAPHQSVTDVGAPMLVNNHRSELKARSYLDYLYTHIDAADREALIAEYTPKPGSLDKIKGMVGMAEAPRKIEPQNLFADQLSLNTRVEPLKDSHILRIQVRDEDPERAARIANHYVDDYISYSTEQEQISTKLISEFLAKKSTELRARLSESEKKLSDYKESHGLVTDAESRDIASEKVRLLTQALADAAVKHSKAKHDMDSVRLAQKNGTDLLSVKLIGDVPDISATRKLLEAAQNKLSNMSVLLGPKHPKVLESNREIATLQGQLDANIAGTVAMIQQEENNSQFQIDDVKKQLDSAKSEVLADGGKNAQINVLKDQVAADRELYNRVELRRSQTELTELVGKAVCCVSRILPWRRKSR